MFGLSVGFFVLFFVLPKSGFRQTREQGGPASKRRCSPPPGGEDWLVLATQGSGGSAGI